jgi:alkaline phosphatase
VIFLIGDGTGFEQVKAAGMYANGQAGMLSFKLSAYNDELTAYSASSSTTDAATAAALSRIQGKSVTKRYFRNSYARYKMVLFLMERKA